MVNDNSTPDKPICTKDTPPGTLPSGPLDPAYLSADIAIGRAPAREEFSDLKAAGFQSIINSRMDSEQDYSPLSAESGLMAAAHGLAYRHVPVEGRNPLEKDVRAFAAAAKELPGPIYAYCRTGGRSAGLWALASVGTMSTEAITLKCQEAGYDVSGLKAKMDMRRNLIEDGDDED